MLQKPDFLIELEKKAQGANYPTDILDDLEAESGYVELTLSTGEKVYGAPDCVVWNGEDETIKQIRFIPYYSIKNRAVYYGIEDIVSYIPYKKSEIPPCV